MTTHVPAAATPEARTARPPISTYRIQLHPSFAFAAAAQIVPYLDTLGVTDAYLSPLFTPRPGSTHGYDVCNHNEISPELGGEARFLGLASGLRDHGLGLLLDIVPNHMGNDPHTNQWWRDVLENGQSSRFASYFDIDWNPVKPELKDKLLLPVLGEQYGEALESGKLRLVYHDGALLVDYGGYRLPINPRRAPVVYEAGLDALTRRVGHDDPHLREFLSILTALRNLPPYTAREKALIVEREREKELARARLARLAALSAPIRDHIDESVEAFNGTPGRAESFDRLHGLLELQAYRLASWRTAADEINYRRFFDINDLAGLRVEDPAVFDDIHRLVLRLIGEGYVTGLRVDHIDGLADPAAYLARLREVVRERLQAVGRRRLDDPPFYVVVEKILSGDETLPASWAAHGTTGYAFLNDVNGLFVNGQHARSMIRTYARLTGRDERQLDVDYDSKRVIIGTAMTSEMQVLANAINRLSESDRRSRDFTFGILRRTLREVIACFPVYRTYVSRSGADDADRRVVDVALGRARARNPAVDPSIFEFLRTVLLPAPPVDGEGGPATVIYERRLQVAMRLQQYTAPVQAKGVEDTAFYRHAPLLSLNEVGGDPDRFGRSPDAFHAANAYRRTHWPFEMNTTATHDTKRGEDARARLNVLSEMPAEWRESVTRWARLNRSLHTLVAGEPGPDKGDEHHFYQALLAVWPPEQEHAPVPSRAPHPLTDRLRAYMSKAIREAKIHTSWISPNRPYEEATDSFVLRALSGDGAAAFLPAFVPVARRVARAGMVNSLAQLTLKLLAPGVPDFYQGTEFWDLTLVDPDNRSPVDFAARREALAALEPLLATTDVRAAAAPGQGAEVAHLVNHWQDGHIKLFVTAAGLRLRKAYPDLFLQGTYRPIETGGSLASHLVAFAREHDGRVALAVVPRLCTTAGFDPTAATAATSSWRDTRLLVPAEWRGRAFRSVLTGGPVATIRTAHETWIMAATALAHCPVAIFWSDAA